MKVISKERKALYDNLFNAIRNSPIETIEFEGNTYHFKLDYKLPYGESHYSRIFLKLIYLKECLGIIKPGDTLLETTSGSGGRSAASVAIALGYKIKIAIPAGGEKAREEAIKNTGAELFLTPAESYVNGFPEFIKKFLIDNPDTKYINHVMGDITGRGDSINDTTINAFYPFIEEVIEAGIQPDIVICPLGNGTTTLPMVTSFKRLFRKIKVIGFESLVSANGYHQLYPDKFQKVFGLDPEEIQIRHDLPGTTPNKTIFPMPALRAAIPQLDGIGLVTSDYVNEIFSQTYGFNPCEKSDWVIKWDDFLHPKIEDFGRTGKAGFAVAVTYARKKKLSGKQFLIPVFDAAWHYDKK